MTAARTSTPRTTAGRSANGSPDGGFGRRDGPRVPRRYGQWAAAVLFVLVVVAAAGWLWQHKSDRVEVWQARVAVPAGSVIERGDLTTAQVSGVPAAIPVGQVGTLVGSTAAVSLVPGQVLTAQMVTADPVPVPGQRVVGLAVDAARAPAGLVPGDVVTVLAVPPSGDASRPEALHSPEVLAEAATVRSVGRVEGGGTRLSVLVSRARANAIAAFDSAGRIAVVQAPVGGDG